VIVNHKYKFIFLKTRKTASTSIEIALSKFCGVHDTITPITGEDELIREALGFPGPQNYKVPLKYYMARDWFRFIGKGKCKKYKSHATARFVRGCLPGDMWNSYFKFCFERDPFDKAISRYYWSTRNPRPAISDYLCSAPFELLSNWSVYTITDQIAVDFVGNYEKLSEHMEYVRNRLGITEKIVLPKAKNNYRENREHYSRLLNQEARNRIEIVCAKEIKAFGFFWDEF
jgi:hypothetical protein